MLTHQIKEKRCLRSLCAHIAPGSLHCSQHANPIQAHRTNLFITFTMNFDHYKIEIIVTQFEWTMLAPSHLSFLPYICCKIFNLLFLVQLPVVDYFKKIVSIETFPQNKINCSGFGL